MQLDTLTFDPVVFIFGCIGGLLPDVLRLVKNRYDPNLPAYLRSLNFWLGVIFLVILGGLIAWLATSVFGGESPYWNALVYGYSAPQLLSTAAGAMTGAVEEKMKPATAGDEEAAPTSRFSVRNWWAS